MFCRFSLIYFCIYFCSEINSSLAQDGAPCQTPDQKSGTCISINDCSSLLNLLLTKSSNTQVRGFLRESACGYQGETPKVCCLQQIVDTIKLPESPNCGFSNVTTPRIVNGVPAKLGEFPWIVALGYRNSKNPQQPKWFCGGSLITERHVLTAAHCVHNRKDLYLARLGDLDLFSDDDGASPVTIPITKATVHENFDANKYINDIAILTLREAPNNPTVWPICLPVKAPYRSMNYLNFTSRLAGWGSVSFSGPGSPTLQVIFLPVLNNSECERVFKGRAVINEKTLCAGSTQGNKDACGGDSGGPLMNEISEGTHNRVYQIGIVSYGFRCAEVGYPGVYTRVTAFIDWIQDNLS